MIDVALHILGAAIMMAPAWLKSTPLKAGWFLAVAVAGFWFFREYDQAGFTSIAQWSGWKLAEAMAPCATAFGCAIGATLWRVP